MIGSGYVTKDEMGNIYDKYKNSVYRLAFAYCKNTADAEDAVQETFIKYFQKYTDISDSEHEKAWLITVATNKCRDMLRYRTRHATESEDLLATYAVEKEDSGILEALMELSDKYRIIMVLFYVEQYKIDEIAKITGISASAVKMRLSRGRKLLEEKYRKEYM